MESLFNGQFEFETESQLKEFLSNMDNENSIEMILMALEMGNKHGIYSIEESYVIHLCISKLKSKI